MNLTMRLQEVYQTYRCIWSLYVADRAPIRHWTELHGLSGTLWWKHRQLEAAGTFESLVENSLGLKVPGTGGVKSVLWNRKHVTPPCGMSVEVNGGACLASFLMFFFFFPLAGFWAIVMHPTCVNAVVVYHELPVWVQIIKWLMFTERLRPRRAVCHISTPPSLC